MEFDSVVYKQTAAKIELGLNSIEGAFPLLQDGLANVANVGKMLSPAVVGWVLNAMAAFGEWIVDVLKWLWDLVQGILAPITFYVASLDWEDRVQKHATDAQAHMNGLPIARSSDPLWQGRGAEAYKGKVPAQLSAAQQLGELCHDTSTICLHISVAGALLYTAIGGLIATVVAGVGSAAAEAASLVLLPAVPGTISGTVSVSVTMLSGIAAILDYMLVLIPRVSELTAKLNNSAAFPGPPIGHWPKAVAPGSRGVMDDATVTDGDADWSVPQRT